MVKFIPVIWVRIGKTKVLDLEKRNLFTFKIYNRGTLIFRAMGGNKVRVFGTLTNYGSIHLPNGLHLSVRGKIIMENI